MASIAEVRQKYPQYSDMSDRQLADALHAKFYADMPKADFDAKIGLKTAPAAPAKPKVNPLVDAAKSFGPGVNQGIAGVVGMFGDAAQLGSNIGEFAVRQVGRAAGVPESRLPRSSKPLAPPNVPTSQGVNNIRQAFTGQDYQPQTEAGRVSRAVGRNAVNALVPGNPVQKAANVLAPALGGEGARYAAEKAGAGPTGQAVAEFAGSMAGGVGANVRIAPGPPKPARAPKVTVDELRPAKDAAYRAVDNAGVQYKPEAVNGFLDDVKAKFGGDAVDEVLHPKVARLIKRLEAYRDQPLTLTKIDQLRRGVRDNVFTATASKDERRLGYQLIDELDGFVNRAGPGDVVASREIPAVLDPATGKPAAFYHGSPRTDLTELRASETPTKMGFPRVVSVSTDPKFSKNYAGEKGRVYEANVHANRVGDYRKPEDVERVVRFYAQKAAAEGDGTAWNPSTLSPDDIEGIRHGEWRFWENPDLWKEHGWDGAWNRELTGRSDATAPNLSLASGEGVRLLPNGKVPSAASDPAAAAVALRRARDLNTRVAKIESIQGARDRAVSRAARTGSGGNVDNALRQEVAKVRDRGRGWTPAERSALDSVETGSKVQNALRTFGKMSPSGNGLMQALNLGAAGKTLGASIPVSMAAYAAKAVADGMTKAKVERVIQLVAAGGKAEAVELAGLASRDQAVAKLVSQIKRVQLGGSTVNALTGRPTRQPSPGLGQAPR